MLPVPDPPGRPGVVAHRWTHHAANVPRAREELRLHLLRWETPAEIADSAVLVLSELLTNAVRHARTPGGHHIETRFERRPDGVRIEVHDASGRRPVLRRPSPGDESGRGLALVSALTGGRWGVDDRAGVGKLVWALCVTGRGGATEAAP